jgi:hypothetical protein
MLRAFRLGDVAAAPWPVVIEARWVAGVRQRPRAGRPKPATRTGLQRLQHTQFRRGVSTDSVPIRCSRTMERPVADQLSHPAATLVVSCGQRRRPLTSTSQLGCAVTTRLVEDDLPPPRDRRRVRSGRGSIYDVRRASGLRLRQRVQLQTTRDELVADLRVVDEQLDALSRQRRDLVDQLADLRDTLYPPIPWCHGRRPPAIDVAPLPPATPAAESLVGRPLRAACLEILRRHGALPLRELHGLLHRYGYVIGSRRPVAALSDAMRHEVQAGRARRLERGVYGLPDTPDRRNRRKPRPPRVPRDSWRWSRTGQSPLDPSADEDPPTWGFAPPLEAGSGNARGDPGDH